ncbi:MAG TPA: DUF4058 family protein, partial [Gemmataceae bacterium]|nr:DUF4058 family protein [Gemmataceae bacterium]
RFKHGASTMPVHDWTRVNAGAFHDFHSAWIIHLKEALNGGLLPEGYYAMAEQHAGPNAAYRATRRTLTIRHVSNHRIIALAEVPSPANKDRASSVNDFVGKVHSALRHGIHLLVVDLFPPGPGDPHGIHGALWESFDPADHVPPADKPLMLAAYLAAKLPEAYLEPLAVGDVLPDMPLFLQPDWYVNVPLESTYQAAYRGVPAYWRGILEGRGTRPSD